MMAATGEAGSVDATSELPTDPSRDALRVAVERAVQTADLSTATARSVRAQLELELGCSLADRKAEIRVLLEEAITARQAATAAATVPDAGDDGEGEAAGAVGSRRKASKPAGMYSELLLSPKLASFLGAERMRRAEVRRGSWVHGGFVARPLTRSARAGRHDRWCNDCGPTFGSRT